MPPRKNLIRAYSLFFVLPYSLIAAFPSKPDSLSPVLADRSLDTAASTFDPQINQDDSFIGSSMVTLFPTPETTSEEKIDTLLGYGDDNSQAGLISADPNEISRCGQNPEGRSQVPSGKGRFKRQKNDKCPSDAYLAKPGVVEQKVPVKDQTPGQAQDDGKPQNPGQNWEPFIPVQKPSLGRTNEGKCDNIEHPVAVCFAPLRSSIVPSMALLGGLMGMLDPVSLDRMLTPTNPYET